MVRLQVRWTQKTLQLFTLFFELNQIDIQTARSVICWKTHTIHLFYFLSCYIWWKFQKHFLHCTHSVRVCCWLYSFECISYVLRWMCIAFRFFLYNLMWHLNCKFFLLFNPQCGYSFCFANLSCFVGPSNKLKMQHW